VVSEGIACGWRACRGIVVMLQNKVRKDMWIFYTTSAHLSLSVPKGVKCVSYRIVKGGTAKERPCGSYERHRKLKMGPINIFGA